MQKFMWLVCEEYSTYNRFDQEEEIKENVCLFETEQEAKDFISEYQETYEGRLAGPYALIVGKPEGLKKKYYAYINKETGCWTDANDPKALSVESEISQEHSNELGYVLYRQELVEVEAKREEERIRNTKVTYLSVLDVETNEIVERRELPAEELPSWWEKEITTSGGKDFCFGKPAFWHIRALSQEQADRIAGMMMNPPRNMLQS
jgi:hypothetical protein